MDTLSESAAKTLWMEIKGWKAKNPSQRLPAYRELAAAGIMESVSATEYRFTRWGMEHRDEILDREFDRIERERYSPPDGELSDAARGLLRRIAAGHVDVIEADRPAFRELAAARVISFGGSFAGGPESAYRLTYWGFHMKDELCGCAKEIA